MPIMHGLNPDTQKFITNILRTDTNSTFMRCTEDPYILPYANLQNAISDLLADLTVLAPSDEIFTRIGTLQMYAQQIAEIETQQENEENASLFSSSDMVEAA